MNEPLLASLRGQDTARTILERSLARDRVHHAYLFEGQAGVGKFLAALGLAQALVCERREAGVDRACGVCSACERTVLREGERRPRHPDVAVVARGLYEPAVIGRKSPESQEISVDQIRTVVLAHAGYGPHEGRARVFILRGAEELGLSAANALLKMLEEPLPRTHFVLVTDEGERLLPTLRSRTLSVRFGPLPDSILSTLLRERGHGEPGEVLARAEGSVARALELLGEEGQEEERRFVQDTVRAMQETSAGSVLALSDTVKGDRQGIERKLRALARYFHGQARAAANQAPERAALHYQLVREAEVKLLRNAAPPLVIESLLFALRRA